MSDDKLKLTINGQDFQGWERVSVNRDLESVCGGFDVSVADKFIQSGEEWPFNPGDDVVIQLGNDKVLTGFLDAIEASFSSGSRTISLRGRDKTAELVDVSAQVSASQIKDKSFDKIAQLLCDPVNVSVKNDFGGFTKIKHVSLDQGESIFDLLVKLSRNQGLLMNTTTDGKLLLTKINQGNSFTDVVQGGNVLSASVTFDETDRYASYIIKADKTLLDLKTGQSEITVKAQASDAGMSRSHRVKVFRGETRMTNAQAQKRAQWEATVRAARAYNVSATVQGWRQNEDGPLWDINSIVGVYLPFAFLDRDMLISRVEFSKSQTEGTVTRLMMTREDAFNPEPTVPSKRNIESLRK